MQKMEGGQGLDGGKRQRKGGGEQREKYVLCPRADPIQVCKRYMLHTCINKLK